ncbi:MAG: leucine-rich repeat protein [Clostridia bacterium]|nr:leucine-rich repeat protein [Clostridia bacterium]
MKKLRVLLVVMCLVTLCLFCLSACGSSGIEKPSGFRLDVDTQTLHWDKVPGATAYTVTIGDKVKTTKSNYFSLESLEPGEYKIEIVALGDGQTTEDSAPAEYDFIRETESGLLYKLINNNTEYQLAGIGSATGDVVMEDEFRGKPVTSIAPSAVANNSTITSFTVGNLITEIPAKAFYNCSALVSVNIPDNVKTIGTKAFQSCKALESITIPETVTEISDYCFSYCRALKSVALGSGVTKIGDYAFSDCSALERIDIPDATVTIGEYAYSSCESAKQLNMGKSVERIGSYSFYSCKLIDKVDFSDKTEYIGENAFEYCIGLTEIALPDALTELSRGAFTFCENLAIVTMGENVESIGRNVFLDTAFLNNATEDIVYLSNWIIVCTNPEINTINGDVIVEPGVVGVADYAFAGCTEFTGITLNDIKYVGNYAFYKCDSLMQVKLGPNALRIGDAAFARSPQLSTVLINNTSLTHIGSFAFDGCNISKIVLPETVEYIGSQAFNGNKLKAEVDGVIYADDWVVGVTSTGVNNVTIKRGTVGIANYSFYGCEAIQNVSMPDSLKYIGRGAFLTCTQIYISEFPTGLERIEDYAFYGCVLSIYGEDYNLVLPEGLQYIGRSAFYQNNILGITIPGSCKYVGDYAFFSCTDMWGYLLDTKPEDGIPADTHNRLVIGDGVEYIGTRAFFKCSELTEAVIPDSVTEMGIRAFYGCESLRSVTVGTGLKDLPDYTFCGCKSLTSVTLADTARSVGFAAFQNCESLTDVYLGKSLTSIGDYAFRGCEALEQLRIPTTVLSIGDFALRANLGATAELIPDSVTEMGQHAMYGNSRVTVYCEAEKDPSGWHGRWNSSFRPVVYGCTFSEDKTYVESFVKTKNSIANFDAVNGISAPVRTGYTFSGWATEQGGEVAYSAADIMNAPNGTTLYAVWEIAEIIEQEENTENE